MSDIAIEVKNLTKEFRIPHRKVDTVFEKIISSVTGNRKSYERFLALDKVSFTVKKGESLGVIGRNGSGKSTLLKLIAGIIAPTKGSIITNGLIMPFIELGVGFQPDLSARENVYLYGSILGLKNEVIEKRYKELVEFAELENFMDMKLKDFSSGMVARLAFSTAIMADPDILLIDEVLAVGDVEFRKKCFEKMSEYKKSGKTIIFVSHDLDMIEAICEKSILLDKGQVCGHGETQKLRNDYILLATERKKSSSGVATIKKEREKSRWGSGEVLITNLKLFSERGKETYCFGRGERAKVVIEYFSERGFNAEIVFRIQVYRAGDGLFVFGSNTQRYGIAVIKPKGTGKVELELSSLPLVEGKYHLTPAILEKSTVSEPSRVIDVLEKFVAFDIIKKPDEKVGVGAVYVPHKWKVLK